MCGDTQDSEVMNGSSTAGTAGRFGQRQVDEECQPLGLGEGATHAVGPVGIDVESAKHPQFDHEGAPGTGW